MAQRGCPSRDWIREFAAGRWPNPPEEVERHLLQCESCGRLLAELDPADPLVATLRQVTEEITDRLVADSGIVDELVASCCALRTGRDGTADSTVVNPSSRSHPACTEEIISELEAVWGRAEQPDELGRLRSFRILRLLGAGGMGAVFLAEELHLHRHVALKFMRPKYAARPAANEQFLCEGRAAAALRHDHIVTIYQVGEENGVPFLAMEYLEGESLEDRLRRFPQLPIAEAVRIAREIADGLAAAHAKGLVHRDITPANIWLEATRDRVKLLDFGLAMTCVGGQDPAFSGVIIGTPDYMSPEQARGEAVDARSDLFSLGCVLYRMLTAQVPFCDRKLMSDSQAPAVTSITPPRQLRGAVPAALNELVLDLLQTSPGDRTDTAVGVIQRLADLDVPPVRRRSLRGLTGLLGNGVAALITAVAAVAVLILLRPANDKELTSQRERLGARQSVGGDEITPTADVAGTAGKIHALTHLSSEGIPESNRASWFPPEIVASLGTDRQRLWNAVQTVAFHPSGVFFVVAAEARRPEVYITRTLERVADAFAADQVEGNGNHEPLFSPDGLRLYAQGVAYDVDLTVPSQPRFRRSLDHTPRSIASCAAIVLSPDGRWMIGIFNRELQIVDAVNPDRAVRPAAAESSSEAGFTKLAICGNGQRIAALSNSGNIHLWDVSWDAASGPQLTPYPETISGGSSPLALSPDGSELIAAGRRYVLDQTQDSPAEPKIAVRVFPVFSPDGRWRALLAPHEAGHLSRRTDEGWKTAHRLTAPLADITAASFSPDSKTLVAGDASGCVHVWDISVDPPAELNAPAVAGRPERVAFSPDGRMLATWGLDGGALWDLTGAVPVQTPAVCRDLGGSPGFVSFSHDSRWIAFPGGIWEVNRPSPTPDVRVPHGHKLYFSATEPAVVSVAFLDGGDFQATWHPWSVSGQGKLTLQNKTRTLRHPSTISDAGGSASLDTIGITAARNRAVSHSQRLIQVWDVRKEVHPICELAAPEELGEQFFCRLSPDGRWLLGFAGGSSCVAQLWDLGTPRSRPRPIPRAPVHFAEFLTRTDQLLIAQGSILSVVDIASGEILREWGLPGPVIWIAAHPDGRHFATVTSNHLVQIWRLP